MISPLSRVHQREVLLLPEVSVPGNKIQLVSPQVLECVLRLVTLNQMSFVSKHGC